MAQDEIIHKIDQLLSTHHPVSEECHVVYLMVEIRKVIDQERRSSTYPVLKFYADWAVHSRKDRITPEIRQVVTDMYNSAVAQINAPYGILGEANPIRDFAYMENLKREVAAFLTSHGINDILTTTKANWVAFVGLMVKVLENQPIIDPTTEVKKFNFEPASIGCVLGTMTFTSPINGNAFYRYGNAY